VRNLTGDKAFNVGYVLIYEKLKYWLTFSYSLDWVFSLKVDR